MIWCCAGPSGCHTDPMNSVIWCSGRAWVGNTTTLRSTSLCVFLRGLVCAHTHHLHQLLPYWVRDTSILPPKVAPLPPAGRPYTPLRSPRSCTLAQFYHSFSHSEGQILPLILPLFYHFFTTFLPLFYHFFTTFLPLFYHFFTTH